MIALALTAAVFGNEDASALLARFAQRCERLRPLHLSYTERQEERPFKDVDPAFVGVLQAQRGPGSSNVAPITKECELWFAWPRFRLDETIKQGDKSSTRRHVWDSGRQYYYDMDANHVIENSRSDLGPFGTTPLQALGIIMPLTVSTNLSALVSEQKNVSLRFEVLPDGTQRLVLGPGLPKTFWNGRPGKRGIFSATFEPGNDPILKGFECSRITKVPQKGQPVREVTLGTRYACSDYRPIKSAGGRQESFPFKLTYESDPFVRIGWEIREVDIGRPIASEVFAVNAKSGTLFQKDGKPVVREVAKTADANAVASNYLQTIELPEVAKRAGSGSLSWGTRVAVASAILGGFLVFVGIWRVRHAQ